MTSGSTTFAGCGDDCPADTVVCRSFVAPVRSERRKVTMPRLSIRARILLAVLERLPDSAADESILYEVTRCPDGSWGALVIWKVPARVGSLSMLGRQVAGGATKDEAERRLLGQLFALPALAA